MSAHLGNPEIGADLYDLYFKKLPSYQDYIKIKKIGVWKIYTVAFRVINNKVTSALTLTDTRIGMEWLKKQEKN